MPVKERPKVHGNVTSNQVEEEVRAFVRRHPNRQLVGEVPNCLLGRGAEAEEGHLVFPQSGPSAEVLHLFSLRAQPPKLGLRQHSVQKHQPLDGSAQRDRFAIAVVWLIDGGVERPSVDMKDPGSTVRGGVSGGPTTSNQ